MNTVYPGEHAFKLSNPIDLSKLKDQTIVCRHCTRYWRALIPSAPERDLLNLIMDQTVGMGRSAWGFSYRMLEYGDSMTAGTGYNKRQLKRFIASLVKGNFITATPNSKGNLIAPNLDRVAREYEQRPPETPERKKVPTRKPKTVKKADLASTLWEQTPANTDAINPQGGDIHVTTITERGDIHVTPPMTCMSPIRVRRKEQEEEEGEEYRHPSDAGKIDPFASRPCGRI